MVSRDRLTGSDAFSLTGSDALRGYEWPWARFAHPPTLAKREIPRARAELLDWALQLGAVRAALSLAAWAALSAYPSIGATLDLAGTLIAGFTFIAGFTNQTQASTSIAK